MSEFRIGQRVRKAHGTDAGNTGVIEGRTHDLVRLLRDADVYVRWDNPGPCEDGKWSQAGDWTLCNTKDLEPLTAPKQQHEASQYSFTELMDRLKAGEVERV